MRLGIQIDDFTWPGGAVEIAPTLGRIVRTADEVGFDSIWVMDHFFQIRGVGPETDPMLEGYTTLGWIAALTTRARLGLMVGGVHYRQAGLWAKATTTLDVLSGGRAWLGIGAAWNESESRGLGFAFPPLGERFERLEEHYAILTGLWGTPQDETFTFDGIYYHLKDSPALPKPVQRPHPPLIVGGGGPRRTPRLAATYGSEFNLPFSSVTDTAAQYQRVRAACVARGRDPVTLRLSVAQTVCCGTNENEVERRASNIGRKADELRAYGVAGTPDEVVARLRAFADIGAETIYLQVLDLNDFEHIDLLADEVLPQVS